MREIERRVVASQIELRAKEGKPKTLVGYGAMFGARSEDLGGFVEEIAPGAFDESLASDGDVLARAEHDSRMLLGRRSSGTLRLSVDATGLRYEVDLPDTSVARDLSALVERGDVKQSSFAFFIEERADEEWKTTAEGTPLRILKRVSLVDVAPVAQPAYQQTTVSARALDTAKGVVQPMKPVNTPKPPTRADYERAIAHGDLHRALRHYGEAELRAKSYEEKLSALWMGLCMLLGYPWEGETYWYVEATFDDKVIVERGFQLLSYPLSWSAEGAPVFGEPTAVEVEYVPAAAAAGDEGAASSDARGKTPATAEPVDLELERLRMRLAG
jgi:HK97 family phage prohead protease